MQYVFVLLGISASTFQKEVYLCNYTACNSAEIPFVDRNVNYDTNVGRGIVKFLVLFLTSFFALFLHPALTLFTFFLFIFIFTFVTTNIVISLPRSFQSSLKIYHHFLFLIKIITVIFLFQIFLSLLFTSSTPQGDTATIFIKEFLAPKKLNVKRFEFLLCFLKIMHWKFRLEVGCINSNFHCYVTHHRQINGSQQSASRPGHCTP